MKKILILFLILFLVNGCVIEEQIENRNEKIRCLKEIAGQYCNEKNQTLHKLDYDVRKVGTPSGFKCIDFDRDVENSKEYVFVEIDYIECKMDH